MSAATTLEQPMTEQRTTAITIPTEDALDSERRHLAEVVAADDGAALENYLRAAFTHWLAALREDKPGIVSRQDLVRVTVAMTVSLSVRDAILMPAIAPGNMTAGHMLAFAARPHERRNVDDRRRSPRRSRTQRNRLTNA